jgi:membrane-associated phospholipid phosphatase
MLARYPVALTIVTAIVLAGCATDSTSPDPRAAPMESEPVVAGRGAVKFWESNATVSWNTLATDLAARRVVDVGRLYAYLSLAQLRGAEAAAAEPGPHPPTSGAIAGASASVLAAFFPADVSEIEAALAAQRTASPWPGAKHQDGAAGEALGRAAASRVLAYAQSDGIGLTNPGTPPSGPGFWIWNGGPIARGGLGARPFFLTSASEFRPGPPPTFGSAAFLEALDEVRNIASTRTQEQIAIANFWNLNQSPRSDAAIMQIARDLIVRYRRTDADAARIMFLASAAAFDAIIGCFDAKYFYWYIRPAQADPSIATVFPTPPHPSYPSAHSCVSGAMTSVLAAEFPSEAATLAGVAEEASLSRLYAGIHYRFDMVAGLQLGGSVARKALSANLDAVGVR